MCFVCSPTYNQDVSSSWASIPITSALKIHPSVLDAIEVVINYNETLSDAAMNKRKTIRKLIDDIRTLSPIAPTLILTAHTWQPYVTNFKNNSQFLSKLTQYNLSCFSNYYWLSATDYIGRSRSANGQKLWFQWNLLLTTLESKRISYDDPCQLNQLTITNDESQLIVNLNNILLIKDTILAAACVGYISTFLASYDFISHMAITEM